jgi:hypothetical protein
MQNPKIKKGKHLPESFSIQNDLKQGDVLSPLLFNFALEYIQSQSQCKWDTSVSGLR